MKHFNILHDKFESKIKRREFRKDTIILDDFEIKPPIGLNHFEINEKISKKKIFGFIQLKLDIESITKDFENIIQEKIKQKCAYIKIDVANPDDIDKVFMLYKRSFLTSKTPMESISIDYLEKLYQIPEVSFYIAKIYGIPAGFMILDFEGYNNEYGFIMALGIIPRFQRKGIGLALGLRAWSHFKERNIKELRCEVYYQNENSIGFLKSLNFQEFAIR